MVACPDCRAYRPCPLDAWYDHLAVAARGKATAGSRRTFLRIIGEDIGRGVFTTWAREGRMRLAEATAWRVYEEYRDAGQDTSAQNLARYVHVADGRQPRLVAAYATILARTGGEETLERAIKVCDEALGRWAQNTADGWPELRAKRGQLVGRLTRLRGRLSSELDEDGNPIPVRRHHPADPRRVRGRRFGPPGRPGPGQAKSGPVAHQDGLLLRGVCAAVATREDPAEDAEARSSAPAVIVAAAGGRPELLGHPAPDGGQQVGAAENEQQPLHASTSTSWAVVGEPLSPSGVA
ncbi:hypothetical protein [Aeromicrobium sp.]|uniref:hypothetical protein n=1 Tax=Aeromicrobium sp. TaxID=1871063 RepID=UPI00403338C6